MIKLSTYPLALAFLAFGMAADARDLNIAAGATYTITAAETDLVLDSLAVGDNARITFADGVEQWRLTVKRAVIGRGVTIDGRGSNGANGRDGISAEGVADECENGLPGQPGSGGLNGGDAVAIDLQLGIAAIGSLNVLAGGGSGGIGGAGGNGQNGGPPGYCRGGDGGAGGPGGAGGNGGRGANVAVNYWAVGEAPAAGSYDRQIKVLVEGGSAGDGGVGGVGGKGAEGAYRKGPGARRWLAAGDNGVNGNNGAGGEQGRDGQLRVQQSLQQRIGAMVREATAQQTPAAAQNRSAPDIAELMRRIEALERRVRQLEQ